MQSSSTAAKRAARTQHAASVIDVERIGAASQRQEVHEEQACYKHRRGHQQSHRAQDPDALRKTPDTVKLIQT